MKWFLAVVATLLAGACDGGGSGADGKGEAKEWDPRVVEFARFVEKTRDLKFRRPVPVDFLTEGEFRKEVTQDKSDLTEEEKVDLAALEGLGEALGLTGADFDLLGAANDLAGEGFLAFYDSEDKRVTVRGTDLTVGVKVTLVHELTHALQDQHFDLTRIGELDTDGANSAFQSVVEGDATRVENAWVAELSEALQAEYEAESAAVAEAATAGLGRVPEWLRAAFGAPYALGLSFVEALAAEGGERAVDRALKTPPVSEEQVVNPERYFAADAPARVDGPKTPSGQDAIDESDFGVLGWLVVLAERIPVADVIGAVDGWGGDAFVTYEEDGRTCVEARVVGDDRDETEEFARALASWAQAGGEGQATAKMEGRFAVLHSCSPPDGSPAPSPGRPAGVPGPEATIGVVATRSGVFAGAIDQGASPEDADCYARNVLAEFSPEELNAESAPSDLEAVIAEVVQRCFG